MEIKEKLLCALKSNIDKLKYSTKDSYFLKVKDSGCIIIRSDSERIEIRTPRFYLFNKIEYKYEKKYDIVYDTFRVDITKEEYDEILAERRAKIEEKQLKELDKLCNQKGN